MPLEAAPAQRDRKREGAQEGAEPERGRDQRGVPADAARDLEGRHAGVVHGGDAQPQDRTAHGRRERDARQQGDAQAEAGQEDCDEERDQREAEVVAAREPGLEGEHRHEMGRPDAGAASHRRDGEPDGPQATRRSVRMVEQHHGGEG